MAGNGNAAIAIAGLTKRYGAFEALRGVDLTVPRGTLFGLLGSNGAGKTTLIKAIVGALRPSGGMVRTLGLDPLRDRAALRQQLGYMPQSPALYDEIRDHYLESLGSGVSARIMSRHAAALQALVESIGLWSERQLDRCQLPHPLLGPLTVREMLFFTLYHNRHHLDGVRRRRGDVSA